MVKVTGYSSNKLVYSTTAVATNLNGYVIGAGVAGDVYLVLDSAIKIRIALNTEEAPVNVSGGKLITKVEDGEVKYYVDIEGLTAADLNTLQVVTVDGVEIGITALAIANVVISDTASAYDDNFKDLMRALFSYYYYTDAYVKTF